MSIYVAGTFGSAGLTNRRRRVNETSMSHVSGMKIIKEGVTGNLQSNVKGGEEVDVQESTCFDWAEVRNRYGIILTKYFILFNDRDVMMMRLQTHSRHDSVARSSDTTPCIFLSCRGYGNNDGVHNFPGRKFESCIKRRLLLLPRFLNGTFQMAEVGRLSTKIFLVSR